MAKDEKFNILGNKARVLVAPLDWGLGHATRCIPVIFKLLQQNCEVIVAAEAGGKILLQKEFPQLIFIDLRGYRVLYSKNKFWLPFKLLLQFPKILHRIHAEKRWLKNIVDQYKIDAVISDNRLGLSHSKICCIYITHQLKIKTGNKLTEWIAQKMHYHFINKYSVCWVPDAAGDINLAGELSHPSVLPKTPVTYLGPLSRFKMIDTATKYDLCVVLSGPEPQRSIFEKVIVADLKNIKGNVILIRGLPNTTLLKTEALDFVEIKNHLPSEELNHVLQQSRIIICRSGYSSVMDLVKLQKQAILIPTPGQTEQEYLADYLMTKNLFYCVEQKQFSLSVALKAVEDFNFATANITLTNYEEVIENFAQYLLTKN